MSQLNFLITEPKNAAEQANRNLVLAHGAGAGMDTEFMDAFAKGLSKLGIRVIRFEFAYMAQRRETGKRRPPSRAPALREEWLQVIAAVKAKYKIDTATTTNRLVIGGKSMGGRIASLVADEADVDGLICLGYPFHPAGKPDKLRTEHLEEIETATLIVQGERDSFGTMSEVKSYPLSSNIELHWLSDGDHSFKPRKKSGRTLEENMAEAIEAIAAFIAVL